MKMKGVAAGVVLALASGAQADTILGVYASAGVWDAGISGNFHSEDLGSTNIDAKGDLGLKDDKQTVVSIALEHPIPVVPNILLRRTPLEFSGSKTTVVQFDNQTFAGVVDSKVDLTHTDATLYYEILDNWVNLDLGLTARLFDGQVALRSSGGQSGRVDIDAPIPMLYAKAQFDLPFSGLKFAVEGNGVGYGGNTLTDVSAKIGYESKLRFGIEGGYRRFGLKLDDVDDFTGDLTIDGPFLAVTLHI